MTISYLRRTDLLRTALLLCACFLGCLQQMHAQPDAYGLSATGSSYKWLTVSQSTGLGALQNLPVAAGTTRYNGQLAQRSQMVRRDHLGNILFFVVDGRVYDGQGYLIADSRGTGCQQCVDPGIVDFISTPVPGSCTRFFLFSASGQTLSSPARIQWSVLDLEANNPYHAGRKGALLQHWVQPFTTLFPSWAPLAETGTGIHTSSYVAALPVDAEAKGTSPIIRVVRSGTGANAHQWLFLLLKNRIYPYKVTSTEIAAVNPVAGYPYVELYYGAQVQPKEFVRDADVFRNGNEISVAMVDGQAFTPYPQPGSTNGNLTVAKFNNTSGALIGGTTSVYQLLSSSNMGMDTPGPSTGVGSLTGCVFGTNANTLWLTGQFKISGSWVPRIGTFDLTTATFTDRTSLVPSAANYVHSRIYRNRAPNGGSEAIYFPTATNVGVLTGIETPGTATFSATGIAAPAPLLSIPATGYFMPRFLNEGVKGEDFLTHFTSEDCCISRQNYGAVYGHTVSTSNTFGAPWQPGSHPFGGGSTIVFSQDLVVPAGKRLYLNNLTIRFAETAKLLIQKGGYVHTRNTRLTAYDCVNAQWQGVRIDGTYTMPQTSDIAPANHGRMEMTSTSMIEYAQVGVQLGADITIPFYILGGGGILNADNSSFLNCKESVRIHPYQNFQSGNPSVLLANRTNFRNTTFNVNASYPAPYDFQHHAYMNLVSGIVFTASHFKNERADASFSSSGSLQLGHGIRSLDAEFKVLSRCAIAPPIGQPCAPANVVRSTFVGLDHGIHALVGTTTRAFEVDRAAFTNNICGVYTLGTVGYKVTNNNFTLGNRNVTLNNNEEALWLGHHRGVYSSSSYGFTIDDNSFQRQGTRPTEGIVIGYSRDHNDIVFRNTASGMDAAYVGEGTCCDINQKPLVGLQFRCNQNNGNGFNIWNRVLFDLNDDLPQDQTIRTVQGQLNFPAGNTFDRAAGGTAESDLHYNWNLNVTNYIGHAPGSVYDPLDIDATYFPKTIVTTAPGNVCTLKVPPLNPEPPEGLMADALSAILEQEREAAAALRYVYNNLIDGGNTNALVQEITDTWPTEVWDLRESLVTKSPYLSTEVLVEAVQKNILPQAVVLEVCLANPEATQKDGFLKWMEYESSNPLPAYMLGLIEESWQTKTFRFALENELAGHYANMAQTVNTLLQVYHADTLYERVDSLRYAWQQLRSPAARYAEAMALVQLNNFEGAATLIEGMGSEHRLKEDQQAERGRMLTFIAFLQGVQASGRALADLTEGELDQLENTVAVTNDRPGTWARNILCFHYDRCVPPPSGWDSSNPKSNRPQPPTAKAEQTTVLQVYPNPAVTWVTFAYELDAETMEAFIHVKDVAGREVVRLAVANRQGQVAWDPRGLALGAYTVELRNKDGLLMESTKLVVQ